MTIKGGDENRYIGGFPQPKKKNPGGANKKKGVGEQAAPSANIDQIGSDRCREQHQTGQRRVGLSPRAIIENTPDGKNILESTDNTKN